jgi:hypothetical protein
MERKASEGQSVSKKNMLVGGLGAAFVAAGVTFALLAGNASGPVAPATSVAPEAKACRSLPLVEYASVENGGAGTIRFREGDYLSPPVKLTSSPQPIVFPHPRPETEPMTESIIIEGNATNVVLSAQGEHFVIPRVDGSYSYTMRWRPAKSC